MLIYGSLYLPQREDRSGLVKGTVCIRHVVWTKQANKLHSFKKITLTLQAVCFANRSLPHYINREQVTHPETRKNKDLHFVKHNILKHGGILRDGRQANIKLRTKLTRERFVSPSHARVYSNLTRNWCLQYKVTVIADTFLPLNFVDQLVYCILCWFYSPCDCLIINRIKHGSR